MTIKMTIKFGNYWSIPFMTWHICWENQLGVTITACDKTAITEVKTYYLKFFCVIFTKPYTTPTA